MFTLSLPPLHPGGEISDIAIEYLSSITHYHIFKKMHLL